MTEAKVSRGPNGGLGERGESGTGVPTDVDVSQWNDLLAERVAWTPLKRGGASFRTHVLVRADPGRMEFRPTLGAKLFALVFVLCGLGLAAHLYWTDFRFGELDLSLKIVLRGLVAVAFVALGIASFASARAPIVFDALRGEFGKGRAPSAGEGQVNGQVRLHEIHALQLVSERVASRRSHFWSHELNLVLDDARRIHVVDHGAVEALRADASQLSVFLGKPVWDAARSD